MLQLLLTMRPNISGGTGISTETTADGTVTITNDSPHVATNLGSTTATGQITITSSTGNNVVIGEATSSIAGLMSTTHHDKLDGIEASATADQTASEITALLNDVASYSLGTTGSGTIAVNNDMTVAGSLTVTGTVTTENVETVSTSNGVVFEGSASDNNEITLKAGTVSADRTITLPDATGTVAVSASGIITLSSSWQYHSQPRYRFIRRSKQQ